MSLGDNLRRFEVKFGVAGSLEKWSVNYIAENFADAEFYALSTLAHNDDRDSYIISITYMG